MLIHHFYILLLLSFLTLSISYFPPNITISRHLNRHQIHLNGVETSFISSFSMDKFSPRLILLDRDGVINHDVGAPGVLHPSQLELTNGAADSIANLRKEMSCKIAIITNQSCVGKGLIDEMNDLKNIHDRLQKMLLDDNEGAMIDKIFYCTSLRNSNDPRMKPNPGMIHEACDYFGVHASESVMIGDAIRDLEAAASAGVPWRVLVETGYGLGIMNGEKAPCGEDEQNLVTFIDDAYCRNLSLKDLNPKTKISEDRCDDTFLPFFYARDLTTASKWILKGVTHST